MGRLPGVRAADGPAELVGEPGGLRPFPGGFDAAAGSDDRGVVEGGDQSGQPARVGDDVVVEEDDEFAVGVLRAGVAVAGDPRWYALASTVTSGSSRAIRSARAGWWSTTTMISAGGGS